MTDLTKLLHSWDIKLSDFYDQYLLGSVDTARDALKLIDSHNVEVQENERRRFMWLHHGHIAALYGDDGEMQCSLCRCDYKREPISQVEEKWQAAIGDIREQAKQEQYEKDCKAAKCVKCGGTGLSSAEERLAQDISYASDGECTVCQGTGSDPDACVHIEAAWAAGHPTKQKETVILDK